MNYHFLQIENTWQFVHTGDIEKSETIAKGATEKILQLCDRYYDEMDP